MPFYWKHTHVWSNKYGRTITWSCDQIVIPPWLIGAHVGIMWLTILSYLMIRTSTQKNRKASMHLWQHGCAEVLGSLGVMGHDINASEDCLGVVLQQMKDTFAGLGKGKEAGEQKFASNSKSEIYTQSLLNHTIWLPQNKDNWHRNKRCSPLSMHYTNGVCVLKDLP